MVLVVSTIREPELLASRTDTTPEISSVKCILVIRQIAKNRIALVKHLRWLLINGDLFL